MCAIQRENRSLTWITECCKRSVCSLVRQTGWDCIERTGRMSGVTDCFHMKGLSGLEFQLGKEKTENAAEAYKVIIITRGKKKGKLGPILLFSSSAEGVKLNGCREVLKQIKKVIFVWSAIKS